MLIEDEVIGLVARKMGIPLRKITPEKTFYQLGIDGDDPVELIAELCKQYQVSTQGVDLKRYVGPECGPTVISHLFNAFQDNPVQKDFRIRDLIRTAQDGQWFDQTS